MLYTYISGFIKTVSKNSRPDQALFLANVDDVKIKRNVSLFSFLHSFIFLLLLSFPYFFSFAWLGGCL